MASFCPHIVGYDYPEEERFAASLRYFYSYGVRTALIIKGEPFPTPSHATLTTLQMLQIAKGMSSSHPLELAVAGQLPKKEGAIKRELEYLAQKIEAGAKVVLTQPVHDLRKFELYCGLLERSGLHQRASFRPGVALWSGVRNAWFWSRLLKGVEAPLGDITQMLLDNPETAAVRIAKRKIKAIVDAGLFGGCLIFPFSSRVYPRIPGLVSYVRELQPQS
jgi:5,10-methylenetetrahydrofolate reductase